AHERYETLRQDPLAVPDAVLQIQVAEPRPVAPGSELVPLREEIPVRVRLHHERARADLVEERAARKCPIVLVLLLDAESREIVDQHGVRVAVASHGVRRPLLWARRCIV